MKIETAVTYNGNLVDLVGKVSNNVTVYQLDDDYGTDLLLVDSKGNVIGNVRVVSEYISEVKIKEVEE